LKAHSYKSESDGKGGLWHLVEVCLLYEIWPFLGKLLKSTVVAGKSLQQQKKNVFQKFTLFQIVCKKANEKKIRKIKAKKLECANYSYSQLLFINEKKKYK